MGKKGKRGLAGLRGSRTNPTATREPIPIPTATSAKQEASEGDKGVPFTPAINSTQTKPTAVQGDFSRYKEKE